jgi:hypothetical protein
MILEGHPGKGILSAVIGVVMACPYLNVIWETKKPTTRSKEGICISSGKVCSSRAEIRVKDGITAENVV